MKTYDFLWQLHQNLVKADFEFGWDMDGEKHHYTKGTLVDVLATAVPSGVIFDHDDVEVIKEPERLGWRVCAFNGTTLVRISWKTAYDWVDLLVSSNVGDLLSALEMCLVAEPLTAADKAALTLQWPNIIHRRIYTVDAEHSRWEIREVETTIPAPAPVEQPVEMRKLSLNRKIWD